MKNYIALALGVVLAFVTSGCLGHGLDEIDTYSGADITSFEGVYYRYTTDKNMAVSGEPQVKQLSLQMQNAKIDAEKGTATVTVKPTSNFPAGELGNLVSSNLVVCLNISVASTISPASGSPRLGVPADWSSPHSYVITAADGSKKDWVVTVTLEK